ncbi:MAG: PKD domain-containing protein [Bacteroidales bacterium]|nr:PKD domain-containing protein [Bacteroidales bacterium]
MKKNICLILLLPFMLMACEKDPQAHFSATPGNPVVGEGVTFTNTSKDAVRFEWDFGDGWGSDEAHPTHVFTGSGTFEVIMTAFSKNGQSDKASLIMDVKIPTLLEIEVREWFEEYLIPDASVRLYPTLPDWENETNMESEGFTDKDGIVVFSHLKPFVYYVDVWEETHNNYALKAEDVGFIRTSEVMPNKINRFIAWVDYVGPGKGEISHDRSYVIRKLERKTADKPLSSTDPSDGDWKALYDRSIKLK